MTDAPLQRWVSEHAPDVLAEAEADALALARRMLRDRLAEALVKAAQRDPGPASRDPFEGAVESQPGDDVLWLYGVVAADTAVPRVSGIDGLAVETLAHGGFAALVSRVSRRRFGEEALAARLEDLASLERLARAHDGVLGAALEVGDVVPFRMCTIYGSPESLQRMLGDEADSLAQTLARVHGAAEWGIKAFLDPLTDRHDDSGDAQPSSGAEYLARRRESHDLLEATRQAADTAVAEVYARLADRAAAATLARPQDRSLTGRDAEMVLNAAYLVTRDDRRDFMAVAQELRDRHAPEGLVFEITGPWPPYHFVGGQVT